PDPDLDMDALLVQARQELHVILDRYDYNQTHAARALDVSRKTLIRLMKTLGFVRAKDLSREQIEEALAAHNNDIHSVSQALRISRRGLQLRINQLGIEA
ncbi:MAG: helix-turn-helix domain-containing protein, partial [Myxococcota bacterium]